MKSQVFQVSILGPITFPIFKSGSGKSKQCMRTEQQPTSGGLYDAGNILRKIITRQYPVKSFRHKEYKNRRP